MPSAAIATVVAPNPRMQIRGATPDAALLDRLPSRTPAAHVIAAGDALTHLRSSNSIRENFAPQIFNAPLPGKLHRTRAIDVIS